MQVKTYSHKNSILGRQLLGSGGHNIIIWKMTVQGCVHRWDLAKDYIMEQRVKLETFNDFFFHNSPNESAVICKAATDEINCFLWMNLGHSQIIILLGVFYNDKESQERSEMLILKP